MDQASPRTTTYEREATEAKLPLTHSLTHSLGLCFSSGKNRWSEGQQDVQQRVKEGRRMERKKMKKERRSLISSKQIHLTGNKNKNTEARRGFALARMAACFLLFPSLGVSHPLPPSLCPYRDIYTGDRRERGRERGRDFGCLPISSSPWRP